jgi:hypothetical protein
MSDSALPPTDDQTLEADDDTLPPEHPAGADAPVTGGESLSAEGIGTGAAGPIGGTGAEPNRPSTPDEDT